MQTDPRNTAMCPHLPYAKLKQSAAQCCPWVTELLRNRLWMSATLQWSPASEPELHTQMSRHLSCQSHVHFAAWTHTHMHSLQGWTSLMSFCRFSEVYSSFTVQSLLIVLISAACVLTSGVIETFSTNTRFQALILMLSSWQLLLLPLMKIIIVIVIESLFSVYCKLRR